MSVVRSTLLQVLVVEDERELGSLFRDYITTLGHRADVVGSAEAALERLRTTPPQVVILDVKLPGISGLDLLALPVVRASGIPVIVVSGHATEEQARQCLRLGALEFLAKPVPLEVLGTVLDHVAAFADSPGEPPRERRAGAGRAGAGRARRRGADGGVLVPRPDAGRGRSPDRPRADRDGPLSMAAMHAPRCRSEDPSVD